MLLIDKNALFDITQKIYCFRIHTLNLFIIAFVMISQIMTSITSCSLISKAYP